MAEVNVSVIIPVYNTNGMYLRQCIDSVINQTYPKEMYEIIVVNDGSTNQDTLRVLDEYKDIIKVINQPNMKTASALNTGIRNMNTESEWFMWLSSDDMWYSDKIEQQMHFIERNPDVKVVYSDWDWINELCSVIKKEVEPEFNTLKDQQFRLCFRFFGCGSTIAIHKSCFDEIGVFNEDIFPMEDYEYWIRLSEKYLFRKVPLSLIKYRGHKDSLTANADIEYFEKNNNIIKLARNKFSFFNDITAIVIGYNVENTIYDCLVAVKKQKEVKEIIFYNDASNDKTNSEVERFMATLDKDFKFINIDADKNMGRGFAKMKALEYANNNLIMFIDGDVELKDNAISFLLEKMLHYGSIRVICGSVKTITPTDCMWSSYKDLISTELGKMSEGTAATLMDKNVLNEVPIDVNLRSCEDSDLFIRLQNYGIQIIKVHTIIGIHYDDGDIFDFLKRNYEYGMGLAMFYHKYPDKFNSVVKNGYTDISSKKTHELIENLRNYAFQLGFKDIHSKIIKGLQFDLEYKNKEGGRLYGSNIR